MKQKILELIKIPGVLKKMGLAKILELIKISGVLKNMGLAKIQAPKF